MSTMLIFIVVTICVILVILSYFLGKAVERVRLEHEVWDKGFEAGMTAGKMYGRYAFCKENAKKDATEKSEEEA